MHAKQKSEDWTDDEHDLRSTEAILDYAWRSYQIKQEAFDKLDSKATTLAGFIGIIIALSGGLLSKTMFSSADGRLQFVILAVSARCFYSLVMMTLAVSFGYCLATLKIRRVLEPTAIKDIVAHYRTLGPLKGRKRKLLKDMIKTIRESENDFRKSNVSKSIYLQKAMNWLIYSLCIGLLGYIWYQVYASWI
jgi:hypothetical protein